MSADGTATATPTTTKISRLRLQAVVTVWLVTGLVASGLAWTLGLQTCWWQRVLLALPLLGLTVADSRGVDLVTDARVALTRGLAALGWLQIPLAVAGGSWLAGLSAPVYTRVALAAVITLVAALIHYAPSSPATAGGTR
ncbi:hypothetical protein QMK19_36360 [Streptomyces sp. H10-C2]|uniref:hypothetical protein n=1 Tax=unclassified Streptomyces TaxID=2593676 RepID=UPI0022B063E9|nr:MULTISPECIES: hypothetical protein [unclassified Streptomyces]MCZ4102666.1 hypothetical protein [Streptomyces sp. H39-C1]MDJ0346363.1 hypothetical protein [Streptomyces sp. PH10-H1]MDJ0374947.1 hypothetical protein [Streptomyces sp. H10-C2]